MMDGGFQNILTPLDRLMDVVVRPMPVPRIAVYSADEVTEITDEAARAIGHRVAFKSSLTPTGKAVWFGLKPLRTGLETRDDVERLIDQQLKAAAEDAARHAALRETFAPYARPGKVVSSPGGVLSEPAPTDSTEREKELTAAVDAQAETSTATTYSDRKLTEAGTQVATNMDGKDPAPDAVVLHV